MFKTMQRSTIKRSLVTAATAVALATVAAAPAAAYPWAVDHPKITNQGIDFGTNWNVFLAGPANGGDLVWDTPNTASCPSGTVRPHLTGNLYLNNASGTTARMQIDYYDAAHNWITTKNGGSVTAPDNALHNWSVDLQPFCADNIYHVHVSTTTEDSSGNFQIVGSVGEDI
jgi:hypothetical protein